MDCRYLVTAWTADIRDEHSLLGATLAALLQHDEIDAEYLQGSYSTIKPLPSIEIDCPIQSRRAIIFRVDSCAMQCGLAFVRARDRFVRLRGFRLNLALISSCLCLWHYAWTRCDS